MLLANALGQLAEGWFSGPYKRDPQRPNAAIVRLVSALQATPKSQPVPERLQNRALDLVAQIAAVAARMTEPKSIASVGYSNWRCRSPEYFSTQAALDECDEPSTRDRAMMRKTQDLVSVATGVIAAFRAEDLTEQRIEELEEAVREQIEEEGYCVAAVGGVRLALDTMDVRLLKRSAESLVGHLPEVLHHDVDDMIECRELVIQHDGEFAITTASGSHIRGAI